MNCTDTFGRVQVRAREGDLAAGVGSGDPRNHSALKKQMPSSNLSSVGLIFVDTHEHDSSQHKTKPSGLF